MKSRLIVVAICLLVVMRGVDVVDFLGQVQQFQFATLFLAVVKALTSSPIPELSWTDFAESPSVKAA